VAASPKLSLEPRSTFPRGWAMTMTMTVHGLVWSLEPMVSNHKAKQTCGLLSATYTRARLFMAGIRTKRREIAGQADGQIQRGRVSRLGERGRSTCGTTAVSAMARPHPVSRQYCGRRRK
jgi:hypothetical protein